MNEEVREGGGEKKANKKYRNKPKNYILNTLVIYTASQTVQITNIWHYKLLKY